MNAHGVNVVELQAVIDDPERVETSGSLVAYYGRVADRRFRIVAIAETDPLVITYFETES